MNSSLGATTKTIKRALHERRGRLCDWYMVAFLPGYLAANVQCIHVGTRQKHLIEISIKFISFKLVSRTCVVPACSIFIISKYHMCLIHDYTNVYATYNFYMDV